MIEKYDRVIFGAGMFGLYAALNSSRNGYKTLIVDTDERPFSRASYVNQARVHNGYHYPRSISTAISSSEYFARFVADYSDCINLNFDKIYGISKSFSWASSKDFVDFCDRARIPFSEVPVRNYFNASYVDAAFKAKEYSFDAKKIRDKILAGIFQENISFEYGTTINNVESNAASAVVHLTNGKIIESAWFMNATYAGINTINSQFNLPNIDSKYELCEVCIVNVPDEFKNVGVTLMDGPFFSIMPFGQTNNHSLTSVQHTPHSTSSNNYPTFSCQENINTRCSPNLLANCNSCVYRPKTAFQEMQRIASKYLSDSFSIQYSHSLFAVKTILKNAEIDDSRPTLLKNYGANYTFFTVFSGKINTIYDMDQILK